VLNEFALVAVRVKNPGFPTDVGGQVVEMILAAEFPQTWHEGSPHHRVEGADVKGNVRATRAKMSQRK
jgi:hypothetical protein